MELKINDWINSNGPNYVESRKAIHIVLKAIAGSDDLSGVMVMKGGTLLGLRYGSQRFTTDVDFSTGGILKELDMDKFIKDFNGNLDRASADLNYGIKCKIQSCKPMPNINGTFPTLKIKIGYASAINVSHLNRLNTGQSPSVISIDYSFNEQSYNTEVLTIGENNKFQAYALTDLIAEKLRSVLQQKVRQRNREQDIYDLNFLLTTISNISDDEKYKILDSLIKKSQGKNLDELLCKNGIRDAEIKERSGKGYAALIDTVPELPDFESSFERIARFYEELPWGDFEATLKKGNTTPEKMTD